MRRKFFIKFVRVASNIFALKTR